MTLTFPTAVEQTRYSPWAHAESLDLRIIYRDLPPPRMGYFHRPARIIVLAADLRQVERRCTLAHELVHFERGDVRCPTDWQNRRQELVVSELASRRLVRIEDLARAVTAHQHAVDQAEDLWVDLDTLTIRLATLGDDERQYLDRIVRAVAVGA